MDTPRVVGIVGGPDAELRAAVEATGADPCEGDPADVLAADPDAVVVAGERSLRSLAVERPSAPVLPVDAGRGVRSVPRNDVGAAVESLAGGDHDVETHPVLDVLIDGERTASALFDVALVPAEAARISEYAVRTDEGRVGPFRADGVVLATAAGASGYARRVGGPVFAPAAAVLAAVPIAPFATDPDHWILSLGSASITVERDDVAVRVLADARTVATVEGGDAVTVTPAGSIAVATVPQSVARYA